MDQHLRVLLLDVQSHGIFNLGHGHVDILANIRVCEVPQLTLMSERSFLFIKALFLCDGIPLVAVHLAENGSVLLMHHLGDFCL